MSASTTSTPLPALTLFVPHLLWPEPAQDFVFADLPLPALEKLLARGQQQRTAALTCENALSNLWQPQPGLSLASLRRLGETDAAELSANTHQENWLCADPTHLRFHQQHLVLADASAFEISADEAARLITDLNTHFGELGVFEASHPQRWYLRLKDQIAGALPPLSAAAGRSLSASLPQDQASAPLRQWLNEIQVFLHQHPLNSVRESAGQPSINCLWLWGGESLTRNTAPACSFSKAHTDQALTAGFARHANRPSMPLPTKLHELLADATPNDHHFVELSALHSAALYEDASTWRAALLKLERDWFAPLASTLATGRLRSATLIAPCSHGLWQWQFRPMQRWQFWKQPRPLVAWLKDIA